MGACWQVESVSINTGGGESVAVARDEAIEALTASLLQAPWGSTAKTELELWMFEFLCATGTIDLANSDRQISNQLRTTPTRVKALRYRWEQRHIGEPSAEQMAEAIRPNRAGDRGDVYVRLESAYLMDHLVARLQDAGHLVRRDFTPGVIRVNAAALLLTLGDMGVLEVNDALWSDMNAILESEAADERRARGAAVLDKLSPINAGRGLVEGLVQLITG